MRSDVSLLPSAPLSSHMFFVSLQFIPAASLCPVGVSAPLLPTCTIHPIPDTYYTSVIFIIGCSGSCQPLSSASTSGDAACLPSAFLPVSQLLALLPVCPPPAPHLRACLHPAPPRVSVLHCDDPPPPHTPISIIKPLSPSTASFSLSLHCLL